MKVFRRTTWANAPLLIGALVSTALVLVGCGRQSANAPSPPPAIAATTRVGVVNLDAVARAHPRWGELEAISKQIQRVESELAQTPVPPPVSHTDIQQALDREAQRMRAEFEKELAFLQQESRRRFDAFASALREEQQAKFEAVRKQMESEGRKAIEAKRDELQAQLRTAEREIMEEYAYPLLNLRLRAEVAGLSSEEEARDVLRQIQALREEREERIKAKGEETEKVFQEFQKAKEAELNARLNAALEELNRTGQQRLAARERELQSEFARLAAEREGTSRARLERRRRELLVAAEAQLRDRQAVFLKDLAARTQRLRAELEALQQQRARLEDSILAEVKIEVATIAQEQKLDVVLTRYIANIAVTDITSQVVQKVKR